MLLNITEFRTLCLRIENTSQSLMCTHAATSELPGKPHPLSAFTQNTFLKTHPGCQLDLLDDRRLLHEVVEPLLRPKAVVRVVVLEGVAVLQHQTPGDRPLRRHPERRLQVHLGVLDDGVRLPQVLLDGLQGRTVPLAQLPHLHSEKLD